MGTWAVAEAKAKLSEVIDSAHEKGVQKITRNGKLVGFVVSPDDWEKRTRLDRGQNARTTGEFFRNSPLVGSGLKITRSKSGPRKVTL